jgi:hypothetical protein
VLITRPEDVIPQLDPDWREIGRSSTAAYLARRSWLSRRVESIELVDRAAVRRRVSVDFEMPKGLPRLDGRAAERGRLVTVSTTPKWPPLAGFNLTGADGAPASMYLRDTNKALDYGLLCGVVEQICRDADREELFDDAIKMSLAVLVASDGPPGHGIRKVVAELGQMLVRVTGPEPTRRQTGQAKGALDLAAQLASHSLLWVPVKATPGEDCIVKFSYLDKFAQTDSGWRRPMIALGWRVQTVFVALPHSGLHTRYHLEVLAPSSAALEIMSAKTMAFPGAPFPPVADDDPPPPAPDKKSPPSPHHVVERDPPVVERRRGEPIASAYIVDRRVHIYHPYRAAPSHRMYLQLRWAASREGYVTGCLWSALIIAGLMTIIFIRLPRVLEGVESTLVLLAAVPVVLGYVLIKPTEHVLERGYVVGVRAMAMVAGAVPMLGAFFLILGTSDTTKKDDLGLVMPVWAGLTIASWAMVSGLILSWLFAAKADERGRDRRWTKAAPTAGLVAGLCVLVGSILEYQPYVNAPKGSFANYLSSSKLEVLIGSALLWVGAIAFWTFLGGTWRLIVKASYRPAKLPFVVDDQPLPAPELEDGTPALLGWRRTVARLLVPVCGVLWMWGTAAVAVATCFQAMSVTDESDTDRVAGFARTLDITSNATLLPAAILVVAATVWLWRRQFSQASSQPGNGSVPSHRSRVVGRRAARTLLRPVAVVVLLLIALRGVSAVGLIDLQVSPQVAWLSFATWVLVVAGAITAPASELSPI